MNNLNYVFNIRRKLEFLNNLEYLENCYNRDENFDVLIAFDKDDLVTYLKHPRKL